MAKFYDRIEAGHRAFISEQKLFFTASAASGSRVNLSPKGLDTLRVLDAERVAYLDLTGSGNETAAHLAADGRLTLMFCAFEGTPLILRLYGRGVVHGPTSAEYAALSAAFDVLPGARQIVVLHVESVQTSCGYGVPLYVYQGDRQTLTKWAKTKGAAGLKLYRAQKNAHSIDGLPTGLQEPAGD